MKNILLILISIFILTSCDKNSVNIESSSKETELSPIENLSIQTKDFFEIDSTGILLFPLNMGNKERSSIYKDMPDNKYWNIIFLNSSTNEYHLLTEKKILISSFDYNYKHYDTETIRVSNKTNHIFYNAIISDFNKDKLLNEEDPIYLFVSDKYGKNFRQISPDNYSLDNWKYIPSSNKVIMTATRDSNNDNVFDEKDEVSTFEIILDKDETPKEVFGNDLKKQLKNLYDRDWKKIK
ncbi:MAG: hypothetical protein QM564_07880 [Bergeyella sp.]